MRDIALIMAIPDLHEHTKRALLWKSIWDYTEREGRFTPRYYWTQEGKDHYKKAGPKAVRREHVIPMSVSIDYALMHAESWSIEGFEHWFENASIVCVVSIRENNELNRRLKNKMPNPWDWDIGDPFARYHSVGITVLPTTAPARGEIELGEDPSQIDQPAP